MPTLPAIQDIRRVVFEHKFGPWSGLREIVGTTLDFGDEPAPPATCLPFNARPDNRLAVAGLVLAGPGYLLYREIDTDRKTFDPRQSWLKSVMCSTTYCIYRGRTRPTGVVRNVHFGFRNRKSKKV